MLAEHPEAAWAEFGPYFLHETNAYARWAAAGGIANATYEEMTDIASVRAHAQYRILTPEAYRDELDAMGDAAFAMLHPMVGGIPPALAWRHLELFERVVLTR